MSSLHLLKPCQWWLLISNKQIAKKYLRHATQLTSAQNSTNIQSAIPLLDSALKLWPQWDQALELKARALLYLRRFKEVAFLLYDYIPSFHHSFGVNGSVVEHKLGCFSSSGLKNKSYERELWRYLVLGQACWHLGMVEDAMILLQRGKKAASAACRKQSNCLHDDSFCWERESKQETDLVTQLLLNMKSLLRKKAAAVASLRAGLYVESIRHFSKIVDNKRGAPQGFIAECYMQRALAYQGAGRITDAIADYNKALALNPKCVEALHARASLFERMKCFKECAQDLEQLKMEYETQLRLQKMVLFRWASNYTGIEEKLLYLKEKLMTIRQRLIASHENVVEKGCSKADAERAYLLMSLRHMPEKAVYFIDKCELADDERDREAVKQAAESSGLRLFRLLQEAYTGVLSLIVDEEKRMKSMEHERKELNQAFEHSFAGDGGKNTPVKKQDFGEGNGNFNLHIELEALCQGFVASSSSTGVVATEEMMAHSGCRDMAKMARNGWNFPHHHKVQPLSL